MAPFNQRKQRLMALQCGATATRQQSKAIIQPRRNLLRRKDFGARSRKLNRQWDAIQPAASSGDSRCILFPQTERWMCCHCTVNKEMYTIILLKHVEVMELLWFWKG